MLSVPSWPGEAWCLGSARTFCDEGSGKLWRIVQLAWFNWVGQGCRFVHACVANFDQVLTDLYNDAMVYKTYILTDLYKSHVCNGACIHVPYRQVDQQTETIANLASPIRSIWSILFRAHVQPWALGFPRQPCRLGFQAWDRSYPIWFLWELQKPLNQNS
jgi:hypothetical protein